MSGWTIKKRAGALTTGDRFIFTEKMGGEGQVLTVTHIIESLGVTTIHTEELDFELDWPTHSMLTTTGTREDEDDDECECSEYYRHRGEHTPGCPMDDGERGPLDA